MDVQAISKKHVLVFETASGQFTIATDDLNEVSSYPWFEKFLNLKTQESERKTVTNGGFDQLDKLTETKQVVRKSVVRAQPVQQAPPQLVQLSSAQFMNIDPDSMTDEVWAKLNPAQRNEYMEFYGLKQQ